MKTIVMSLVLGALAGAMPARPALADAASPAIAFVRQVGNDMPKVLANARTIEQKRARLTPFLAHIVDTDAVARYCVGRYWAHATPRQQQALEALFLSVVVNEVALWTGNYEETGVQTNVVMDHTETVNGETLVPTVVEVGDAPAAHITWVVNMQTSPPRIRDVSAQGISLREMKRGDFTSYLQHHNGDIDGLIGILRQRALATGGIDYPMPAQQTDNRPN